MALSFYIKCDKRKALKISHNLKCINGQLFLMQASDTARVHCSTIIHSYNYF